MSVVGRGTALSIDDRRKIDRICNRFEAEWLAGRRPVIESFLRQIHVAAQPVLLGELLQLELDYLRSLREKLQAADYLRRFPRMTEVIRQVFQTALQRPLQIRFLPGAKIGRYEVRKTLGAGAFAVVYRAWDTQLERDVAVKVPHRYLLADAAARQRLLAEARTIARLKHPRIVALYDVAELPDDETIYLVMQYIAGRSLRHRLLDGPLPPEYAAKIVSTIAESLEAAHQSGVFHRDLKPSNILLDEQGEPHICDFGLALHVDQQHKHEGEYAGTLNYMAPEQVRGESHRLDGRADIWSLGVIHYEMLTGGVPFVGCGRQQIFDEILHRDPRPPRQLDPRISRQQEQVCLCCLAKQPSERFATAGDVARAVQEFEPTSRRNWLMSAMVFAIVPILLGGWLAATALRSPPPAPTADGVPLHATLDLMVWDAKRPDRQALRAVDAKAFPLRSGDQVRVLVQLNQPAYVYLVWLDAHGTAMPVFPWSQGRWEQRSEEEQPSAYLALPRDLDTGWVMNVQEDGLESLLLLVRRLPLPRDVQLREILREISYPPPSQLPGPVWFHEGASVPVDRPKPTAQRPPDLNRVVEIPDPLLRMQRQTAAALRPYFELIHAISFPVRGRDEPTAALSTRPL